MVYTNEMHACTRKEWASEASPTPCIILINECVKAVVKDFKSAMLLAVSNTESVCLVSQIMHYSIGHAVYISFINNNEVCIVNCVFTNE